jgi:hypothetical protein
MKASVSNEWEGGRKASEREVFKTKLMAFLKKHEIDFWMPQKQERKRNEKKRTKFSQLNLFREDYFLRSGRNSDTTSSQMVG